MYYMAIKYMGAYNEQKKFSRFFYKSITSHYLTNLKQTLLIMLPARADELFDGSRSSVLRYISLLLSMVSI